MTDDERDQLLSAVIDGEATADDVARVRADPELTAELNRITAAVAALAEPVPLPPADAREAMIAAALEDLAAAPSSPATAVGEATTGAPVVDLAAQRAKRQRRLNIMGAAAAIVVVIGAAFALNTDGSSDSDTSASSDESGETEAADGQTESAPSDLAARAESFESEGNEASAAQLAPEADAGADEDGGLSQDAIEDALSGDDSMSTDDEALEEAAPAPDAAEPEPETVEAPPAADVPVLAPELGACADQILGELPLGGELRQREITGGEAIIDYIAGDQITRLRWNLIDCEIAEELAPDEPLTTSPPDTSTP